MTRDRIGGGGAVEGNHLDDLPPENVTNHQLYVLLLRQGHEIRNLSRTVEEQGNELATLSEAWANASGVVRFIKFAGALATAFLALWGVIRLFKAGG